MKVGVIIQVMKKHAIELEFEAQCWRNPNHSSYVNFMRAIKDGAYERSVVLRYFNRLVEKDDYDPADKGEIFENVFSVVKKPLFLRGQIAKRAGVLA